MLQGRAHTCLLVQIGPPAPLFLFNAAFTNMQALGDTEKTHEKHSPPHLRHPLHVAIFPSNPRSCQEALVSTTTPCKRNKKVLFNQEAITVKISPPSIMEMYARPRTFFNCCSLRVYISLNVCIYSVRFCVRRMQDEHLCKARRRAGASCSIFMWFPICDPPL